MSNREIIENALKRVNALLGINGKLYKDNTGWFVIEKGLVLTETSMPAGELLAYLHGVEAGVKFNKEKEL
jgi:hypothetical protein